MEKNQPFTDPQKAIEELNQILERISDAFVALDKNWCYTYINKKAGELLQRDPQQMIGKNIWTEFPEVIDQPFYHAYHKAMAEQKYISLEEYYSPYDLWLEKHIYPSPEGLSIYFRDITEKKESEQKLSMAHQRLTSHLLNTPLAIIEWDNNFIIQKWSAMAENIFGWKEAEVLNKHFNELNLVFEEDAAAVGIIAQELMTGAVDQNNIINRNNTKSGRVVYCQWFNSVLKDEHGNAISIMSLIEDITESKKAEIEKIRLLNVLQKSLNEIYLFNPDTLRFEYVNEGALINIGFSFAEMLDMTPLDIKPEHTLTTFRKLLAPLINKEKEKIIFETIHKRADGSLYPVEVHLQLITSFQKHVFLSVILDITKRKKAEGALRNERDRFEKIVNTVPGVIYMLKLKPDGSMSYPYSSPRMFDLFGLKPEELTEDNTPLIQKIHPDDIEKFKKGKIISARNMTKFWGEFRFKHPQRGWIWLEANSLPSANPDGSIVWTGFISDTTERKKGEQEMQQMNEQLRNLSAHLQNIREEERTHIAREIHDQLGQQLTGIRMDASWLSKKISPGDKVVVEKIANMIGLIDDTIKSVRKISTELRPGILDDLGLVAALEWQSGEFEKRSGIKSKFNASANVPALKENLPIGIFRIYQETLTNVARHSAATEVQATFSVDHNNLVLRISDNGKGMNEKEIEQKKTLGLIGMRERALMMGGTLTIESEKGGGTTIVLTVPVLG